MDEPIRITEVPKLRTHEPVMVRVRGHWYEGEIEVIVPGSAIVVGYGPVQKYWTPAQREKSTVIEWVWVPERVRRIVTPYERARTRVLDTPTLHLYQDIILADWNEGNDHWEWVATAPLEEIVDWAMTIGGLVNGPLAPREDR